MYNFKDCFIMAEDQKYHLINLSFAFEFQKYQFNKGSFLAISEQSVLKTDYLL